MLTDAFSKYGNIEHATILTTTHGDDQASPVYGFVQFENEYDCNAALSAVPPFIGDQQVEVHLAKLNPEVKDTIYVTGFDSSVKESQLLAHFKKYNPTDIHIGK
ncbi:hypothetical protein TRFO_08297 [Tritrichomonas foetus]|uniref:RRM domain-containing protein n=1 Tax=Tritrichomonas foetus TaxID=1144522 RepID=A0A1J4JLU8_9EUKA|nr:hypothetical protein TRFO_08297 [Tritrichomonas foetus]|eukprot:OHS99665.1 hypothetical protein TRFO_08297 [Tritrichomonas foetus]